MKEQLIETKRPHYRVYVHAGEWEVYDDRGFRQPVEVLAQDNVDVDKVAERPSNEYVRITLTEPNK